MRLLGLLLAGLYLAQGHQHLSFYRQMSKFEVTAPAGIAGTYNIMAATFGPFVLGTTDVRGTFALGYPDAQGLATACNPIKANIKGAIALVMRGGCSFTTKVRNARREERGPGSW